MNIKYILFGCLLGCISQSIGQNVTAGYYHTAVQCSDSSVWVTGSNILLQKGDASLITTNYFEELNPKGMNIVSGGNNALMLDNNNDVWSWGYNNFGQAATGAFSTTVTKQQIVGVEDIITIESGENNSFAIKSDGSLWGWGHNSSGQLGLNYSSNVNAPVQIIVDNVVQVSASQTHTLTLKKDGTVFGWGSNLYGELGQTASTSKHLIPEEISGLSNVVKVVAGMHFSLAITDDGSVYSWGFNESGTLAHGSNLATETPTLIGGLTNVIDVVAGQSHVIALLDDGRVFGWGLNMYAQVGDGTYTNKDVATELAIDSVTMIVAGEYHSGAVTEKGELYTWGFNNMGQLGDNTNNWRSVPTKTTLPCSVTKIDPVCPTEAVANTDKTIICVGESIEFTASSMSTTTNKWIIDGNEYIEDQRSEIFNTVGTHDIELIANPYGCSDTAKIQIEVVAIPDASFTADAEYCITEKATLFSATDASGTWSGNGMINSTTGEFDPSSVTAGSHLITYTVSNAGCTSESTNTVDVIASPDATITSANEYCETETGVTLAASDNTGTWSGNGITNNMLGEFEPAIAAVGFHTIHYTVANSVCTSVDSMIIEVFPMPDATITSANEFCENETSVLLSAVDANGTWSGTGVENVTTGEFNPSGADVGTHTVYYNVANTACSAIDSAIIEVTPTPTADFTTNALTDSSVQMNNSAINTISTSWDFGDGNTSIESSPTHTYDASGTYTITQSVVNDCGTDVTTLEVTITKAVISSLVLIESGEVHVYPNPAKDKIVISLSGNSFEKTTISIINSLGQTVKSVNIPINPNSTSKNVDVSALANGVYTLNVSSVTQNTNVSIIVNK